VTESLLELLVAAKNYFGDVFAFTPFILEHDILVVKNVLQRSAIDGS
jgi:hypothetical protein